jgi:D-xylose transport system permease protein
MSTAAPAEIQAAATEDQSFGGVLRSRWDAFKGGDVGSVPVLVGIIAITIFFTAKSNIFFTAVNFQNLIGQMAGVTVIAVGIVFVLLIGEIDLSVGYLSGLCSVAVAEFQMAGSSHDYPGLVSIAIAILVGAAFGAAQGSIVAFLGVPSFVVTLAGLLIAQGLIINLLGTQGVIGISDNKILDVSNYILSKNTGWIVAIVFTVLLALATFGAFISRRRAGLPTGNVIFAVIRVVFYGGLAFAAVAVCNHATPRPGVPLVGLIILFVVVAFSYLAGRTTFGRHVYAVGGNAEASRRAGINVKRIRILCFVISGSLAGLGGVILASRLNSVDLTFGGGTLLLDSISAAVIGGVSLFGGRGKVSGALFGGLIIGMISNGTDLVGSADWVKYVTTGSILLAAVTLDTVARHRQAAAGR